MCPCCAGAATATGPPDLAVLGLEEEARGEAGWVAMVGEAAGSAVGVQRPTAGEVARCLPLQRPLQRPARL